MSELQALRQELEGYKQLIEEAGNVTKAAKRMGLNRNTLSMKIIRLKQKIAVLNRDR